MRITINYKWIYNRASVKQKCVNYENKPKIKSKNKMSQEISQQYYVLPR